MILVLMAVCVFVMNGRTIDLWIMFGFGILGYLSERIRILLAPIVLGLILGPLAEQSLRRALLISRGDWTELVMRPISGGLAIATVLVILWPILRSLRRRHRIRAE